MERFSSISDKITRDLIEYLCFEKNNQAILNPPLKTYTIPQNPERVSSEFTFVYICLSVCLSVSVYLSVYKLGTEHTF